MDNVQIAFKLNYVDPQSQQFEVPLFYPQNEGLVSYRMSNVEKNLQIVQISEKLLHNKKMQ